MRRLHDGFQLCVGELLRKARRRVGQHAACRCDLDYVRAIANALTHGARAIVCARAYAGAAQDQRHVARHAVGVAMSAVDADRACRGDDARPGYDAGRNASAQRKNGVSIGAKIGDRGEAGIQRLHREARAVDGLVRAGLDEFINAAVRALFAGDVDMAVDQAGQDKAAF